MLHKVILFIRTHEDVSDDLVRRCRNFKEALKLCWTVSGLDGKQVAMELDIDQGHWSRIWSNGAHFPDERVEPLMELCGNNIPLRWLALKRGYGLHRLKSALEVENEMLKAELEEERKKREIILETFREIRGAV